MLAALIGSLASALDLSVAGAAAAAALATTLLLFAAVVAGWRLRQQIQQAEKQHREQMDELENARKDTLRPALDLAGMPQFEAFHPALVCVIPVVNAGPGPALDTDIKCWITEDRRPQPFEPADEAFLDRLREELIGAGDHPHFKGKAPIIPADGGTTDANLFSTGAWYSLAEIESWAATWFLVEMTYESVHHDRFFTYRAVSRATPEVFLQG